jgi:hypothetical protein
MGVLVVGMHRSGTSALAGALDAMGFEAGPSDDLMEGDEGNPQGYFELRSIASLNDEILAHYRGRWDSPPLFAPGWEHDDAALAYATRARDALAEVYASDAYVLKDPRISLLLPLWRQVTDAGTCAMVIVREPLEVAASLTRRNGLPTASGLALWAAYNRALLRDLEGMAVHICSYTDLVNDPTTVLSQVHESLQAWAVVTEDVDLSSASASIRPDLRRNNTDDNVDESSHLPVEIADLLTLLLDRRGRHDHFAVNASLEPGWWERALLEERRVLLNWALDRIAVLEAHGENLETHSANLMAENAIWRQRFEDTERELQALQGRVDHVKKLIPAPLFRAVTKRSKGT